MSAREWLVLGALGLLWTFMLICMAVLANIWHKKGQ